MELKNNIKQRWWRDMVHSRDDMVGLDSSIIASPRVWEASGHVAGFVDPMVDCRVSKLRYRADQLFFTKVELQEDGEVIGYIALLDSGDLHGEARKLAEKLKKRTGKEGTIKFPLDIKDMTKATVAELALIPSPATGEPGSLTPPRAFNLMFQTSVGALADASSTAFLRPETAQGIFTNFKNVQSTGRVKVPFGIAQIGKAFRNEITPRNFIFRSREFEQMEIEYFIPPEEEVWPDFYNKWIETAWQWLTSIGMREDLMGREVHLKGDLAHYAKACTDIVFRFPFGQVELQGIAARGDYDLTQHQTSSGKSMEYFDESNKRRYVPHVIEPSIGVDRLFLALICSAYAEDEIEGEKRVVLKFHPSMAPIKVGVFPLVKNKPEIMEKARAIYDQLKHRYNVFWDVSGAIGRRYRRMDEAGTPFCITVDFDTLEDDSVTVRERDSTRQTRMKVGDLLAFFDKEING